MAVEITDRWLERIENDLDQRVESLMKSNQKYEQFLKYLTQLSNNMETETKERLSEENEKGEKEKTLAMDCINSLLEDPVPIPVAYDDNDLNKILNRAKEIRGLNDKLKSHKKNSESDKRNENKNLRSVSAPRGGRGAGTGSARGSVMMATSSRNQREPLSKQRSDLLRATSPTPSRSNLDRQGDSAKKSIKNEKSSLHFLITQSQILSHRNLHCPLISIFPTKQFLLSQFHFLSSLTGSPLYPPSLIEKVIQRMIGPLKQQQQQPQYPLQIYVRCLQKIRYEFEKSTQSKLNRVHLTTLTELEVSNIFIWWHLLRRCIEVNENLRLKKFHQTRNGSESESTISTQSIQVESSNSISFEEKRLHNLITQMVHEYPLLPHHSALSSSSQHYNSFESRVRYCVETILGRLLLKEVLQELKECCAEEVVSSRPSSASRGGISSTRKSSRMKWKHALQGLQSMETCLLEGAMNTGATIFFEKESYDSTVSVTRSVT
jgi:hypothetical protein